MTALRVRLSFWQLITRLSYFSQVFLPKKRTSFFFCGWASTWSRAYYLQDPPPFNGPFFMTPPFSESQKVVTLPLFPPPSPLLISDKSLTFTLLWPYKTLRTLLSSKLLFFLYWMWQLINCKPKCLIFVFSPLQSMLWALRCKTDCPFPDLAYYRQ